MVKPGKTLYATKAGGRWFVKQANSVRHFVRLCVEDEKAHGYAVPPRFRFQYEPDLVWSEPRHAWLNSDGTVYGPSLPPGARPQPISANTHERTTP